MRIAGRRGKPSLRLDDDEARLLVDLLDELDRLLDGSVAVPAHAEELARLFPAAYPDDESAAAEFRALTETSLRAERAERASRCRAELADSEDINLSDADTARRWIQVLNDLRLSLGTRLGVTEEDERRLDPADPHHQEWLIYHWLTAVQDTVVSALMG